MIETRLIMLEGLPGTGKTTSSSFLRMQLDRNGCHSKWIHEVARPHPVLFFDEACLTLCEYEAFLETYPEARHALEQIAVHRKKTIGIDLLELEWNYPGAIGNDALQAIRQFDRWNFPLEKYIEVALEKWECFAEQVRNDQRNDVYILDSAIFQYQIFSFLFKNAPYEDLERFVTQLLDIVKPLNPVLIYLFREQTDDAIRFLEKIRGVQFLEEIWKRDQAEPYYRTRPEGAEGHRQFLRDYADAARRLFSAADILKSCIDISAEDWDRYRKETLSFLNIQQLPAPKSIPRNGIYRNVATGFQMTIDGLSMEDPNGCRRSIIPKNEDGFYVECLPVVLKFTSPDELILCGEQICERWTSLGMVYKRK